MSGSSHFDGCDSTDERRKLVVVSHEDERVDEAERPKTGRQRDLRRLVDNADVESPLDEDGSAGPCQQSQAPMSTTTAHSLMPKQVVATICGRNNLLSMSASERA